MSFNNTTLTTGLNVLTYNMPTLQSVSIHMIVKVGSRYETDDQSGISHFLEHMAFKGTQSRTAKDIAEEFDAIGGYFNAYTSREHTVYYAKVLSRDYEKALAILADIIQNSLFAESDISKERNVILQEIAQNQDMPDDVAYDQLYELAYRDQSMGKSILGSSTILESFNRSTFINYVQKYYNHKNMCLSIAGNIEHKDAVDIAQKLFTNSNTFNIQDNKKTEYIGGAKSTVKDIEQNTVVIGFNSVSLMGINQLYHAHILSLILGGGISSRLFQRIREELGLAYSVGSYNSSYSDTGLFSIYAATSSPNIDELLSNVVIEITKISNNISDAELQRAKMQIQASVLMAEEKSAYKSEEIGKNFSIFGRYMPTDEIMEYVMQSTCADIVNIAQNIFSSNPTLSIVASKTNSNIDEHQNIVSDLLNKLRINE